MKQFAKNLLFLSCFFGSCCALAFNSTLTVKSNSSEIDPKSYVTFYKDSTGQLTLSDIVSKKYQASFEPIKKSDNINFGFTNATYWLKLTLKNEGDAPKNWVLEIPYLNLNEIILYSPGGKALKLGTEYASTDKPIFYPLYAFPIEIREEPSTFYLRIRSDYALTIPLTLWQQTAFSKNEATLTFLQSLYFGGLLALALYNFLLFLSLRDRSYLLYTVFALCMGLGMFAGNGYGRLYLWPSSNAWDTVAQSTFFSAAGALALMFACSFLRTKLLTPKLHLWLILLTYAYWITTVALPFCLWTKWSPTPIFEAILLITIPATLLTIVAGLRVYALGHRSALYLLIAWGSVWAGATIAALRAYEILPSNAFTLYSLQISSCLEMLLLSFALAYRINTERNNRLIAQADLLNTREALLRITQESGKRLEAMVQNRTQKLQQSVLDEQTLRQQYVRFGALISHEFRNPLNIISTQSDLILRERKSKVDNIEDRIHSVQAACSRLVRLFEQWLKGDRLQQPLAQPEVSPFSLKELIDSALTEAKSYYPSRVIIAPNTCPALTIYGDRSLIEIAIFNLIDNAVKYGNEEYPIEIGYLEESSRCAIFVTNSGYGITLDDLEKVFEPHYRMPEHTSIYGKGLGLDFVRTVCEMHGTAPSVENLEGNGCRFTIWLPTQQGAKKLS